MTDWHVGQKIVCVNDNYANYDGENWIVKWSIYTIREIARRPDGLPGFRLVEVVNRPRLYRGGIFAECDFNSKYFRPVVEPRADISIFHSILAGVNKREAVDA